MSSERHHYDDSQSDFEEIDEIDTFEALAEGINNLGNSETSMEIGSPILERDINFDRSLPGLHTYLGENSVSIDTSNYQEPGIVVSLRAVYRWGVVLIPGYTLPMTISNASQQQVLEFYRNPVAILPGRFALPNYSSDFIGQVATIAYLLSIRVSELGYNPILLGRQRLRIMEVYNDSQDQYPYCKGVVLPENINDGMLCPVSRLAVPPSWCRFARDPDFIPLPSNDQSQSPESRVLPYPRCGDPLATLSSRLSSSSETSEFARLPCRRDVMLTVASSIYSVPPWIFHQYDLSFIIAQIRAKLSRWTNTWQMEKWNPSLAVPFSYWLLQNLPLTFVQKADFLKIDHVVLRLRACLNFIESYSGLACSQCRSKISSQNYVICLSTEGSVQAYINPHGFIFDMLTLSTVYPGSIDLIGTPTTEYSWFPGYAWTIVKCSGCAIPLGWRFTATTDDLRPRLFWGLKRDALQPITESDVNEQRNQEEPQEGSGEEVSTAGSGNTSNAASA